MLIIDCAFDEKLADELAKYLTNHAFSVNLEKDGIITSDDKKLTKDDLELFLKMTGKIKELQLISAESNTVIIATKVMIEHFDLARCSVCGFVAYPEDLFAHERAHGLYLA